MSPLFFVRLIRVILVLSVIVLISTQFVLAQDTTTQLPTPVPGDTSSIPSFVEVLNVLSQYGAVFGGISAFVVGLLKKFVFTDPNSVPAQYLSVAVGLILLAVYWLATQFGLVPQFMAGVALINNAGQAVLAFLSILFGSSMIHEAASARKVPIWGFNRPTPALAATKKTP